MKITPLSYRAHWNGESKRSLGQSLNIFLTKMQKNMVFRLPDKVFFTLFISKVLKYEMSFVFVGRFFRNFHK